MKKLILIVTLLLSGCYYTPEGEKNSDVLIVEQNGITIMYVAYSKKNDIANLKTYRSGDDLIFHVKSGNGIVIRRLQ